MNYDERCPTKRAPDAGDSAHIPSIFHALAFFWSDGFAVHSPSAGNANRWAASQNDFG